MHEQHAVRESDDLFAAGTMRHLTAGNEGRVLDGRRTPGYIESIDRESCMFTWRITDFEDKGKCWEIPFEEIVSYQFRLGSRILSEGETEEIAESCRVFQEKLIISAREEKLAETQRRIAEKETAAAEWLKRNSGFVREEKTFDFNSRTGDEDLFNDLEAYLDSEGVLELEKKTAEQYLLNPYSGEWIKGMKIVMAELGLISYESSVPRTKDIFTGIGSKALREQYIISRSAFMKAIFKMSGHAEVPLYRGIASEVDFFEMPNTLISATFSLDMAKEFAGMANPDAYRSCCWIKFSCPVDKLFMTFFETKQFNERYKEQEAIIYHRHKNTVG